jgi:hypothetical protein
MVRQESNPPVSPILRYITVLVALILIIGASLFFIPSVTATRWPWELSPFTARFLGALYLGELVGAALFVAVPRWAPGRITVAEAVTFTAVVTVVSFLHLDQFDFARLRSWGWFIIYVVPMLALAYYLWRYRNLPPADTSPLPPAWRAYLLAQGTVLGLYAVALFLAPETFSAFWPWRIDAFHGQMYSAIFLTGSVASFLLARAAAQMELLAQGLIQLVIGLFAILGLIIVDASRHQVNWAAPGTWLWVGAFAVFLISGIGMVLWSRAKAGGETRPVVQPA